MIAKNSSEYNLPTHTDLFPQLYKKQKIFLEKQKDLLSYSTSLKVKKQGEMPLPSLSLIPLK